MSAVSLAGLVAVGSFVTVLAAGATARALLLPTEEADIGSSAVRTERPPTGVVRLLASAAGPSDAPGRDSLQRLLLQAGFAHPSALPLFLALRGGGALVLPALTLLLAKTDRAAVQVLLATLAAGLGYFAPLWALQALRRRRQARIRAAVPNMLDMLVSCVEAGLGVDVALRHVSTDLELSAPELAAELRLVNGQLSAGLSRVEALRVLDERTGVAELAALVNVLGVVERFGAGIAQSLRAHAHLSRRQRALHAETRAARAAPALTVVMVLFILPALFVVLIGSTAVNVANILLPQLAGTP